MGYIDEKVVKPIKDDPLKALIPIPGGGDLINAGQDAYDVISGKDAADAAEEAAAIQAEAGTDAIANLRQAQIEAAARQQPFEQFGVQQGVEQLPGLFEQQQAAISDPSAVINNPFFQAMSRDQEQRLINQRAALGKGGSGGTGDALTRNMLLLGNQFSQQNLGNIQQQIQNRFNAATIGQNAASQTGTQGLQTAGNIGGVMGNIANAQAAGVIGQQQAGMQGFQNLMGIGSLVAAPFTGGASLGLGGIFGGGSGIGTSGGSGIGTSGGAGVPFLGGGSAPLQNPNPFELVS